MVLTRDFRETVQARVKREPAFARALLQEAMQLFIDGDVEAGRSILRDYINATVGFEKLARATNTSPKSLMRMFSEKGNPTASNLFSVIAALQTKTGTTLQVKASRQ